MEVGAYHHGFFEWIALFKEKSGLDMGYCRPINQVSALLANEEY